MVKFINKHTGSVMWVADDRAEEYKAAGHKLAVVPKALEAVPAAVKKTAKKTAKKK